jgi:hypothetical protein
VIVLRKGGGGTDNAIAIGICGHNPRLAGARVALDCGTRFARHPEAIRVVFARSREKRAQVLSPRLKSWSEGEGRKPGDCAAASEGPVSTNISRSAGANTRKWSRHSRRWRRAEYFDRHAYWRWVFTHSVAGFSATISGKRGRTGIRARNSRQSRPAKPPVPPLGGFAAENAGQHDQRPTIAEEGNDQRQVVLIDEIPRDELPGAEAHQAV